MAPTPIGVTGRLTVQYQVSALTHKSRVWVNLGSATPVPDVANHFVGGSGNQPASAVAQALWDLMRPMFNTGVAPASFLLEQYASGSFIPVDGGVLTGSGSSTLPTQLTTQGSMTFKDIANKRVNFDIFEVTLAAPTKGRYPTTNPAIDPLMAAFITTGTGVLVGNFVLSKGGNQILRALWYTEGLNHRLRRSRHVA